MPRLIRSTCFLLVAAIALPGAAMAQDLAGSLLQHVAREQNYVTGRDSSGPTVTYAPGRGDGAIEFTFELEESGLYQVNAMLWYAVMAGMYQPYLNGEELGGVLDFCVSGSDHLWTSFDLRELEAGTHTLRFEGRGTSPNMRTKAPPFHGFALTYLVLLRMEDLDGYQEAMKRRLER